MTEGKKDRYSPGGTDSGLGDDDTSLEDDETSSVEESETADVSTTEIDNESETENVRTSEIPHRMRYDSPKANRTEVQFLLSDDDQQRLRELENLANDRYSEKVYKTDVYLAAARAGFNSTDSEFFAEMKKVGYGFADSG